MASAQVALSEPDRPPAGPTWKLMVVLLYQTRTPPATSSRWFSSPDTVYPPPRNPEAALLSTSSLDAGAPGRRLRVSVSMYIRSVSTLYGPRRASPMSITDMSTVRAMSEKSDFMNWVPVLRWPTFPRIQAPHT